MTVLAKPAILAARERGDILIEPYKPEHIKNCSVDVTLGEWYWRERPPTVTGNLIKPTSTTMFPLDDGNILNPYDEQSVKRMWGDKPLQASKVGQALPGISAD